MTTDPLARSRRDLEVARLNLEQGYPEYGVSVAYFAAFHAAAVALEALGEPRSKTHAGLISAFGRRLVLGEALDKTIGRRLNDLQELRLEANYGDAGAIDTEVALQAIADAEFVVEAVAAWLATRDPEPGSPPSGRR